MLSTWRVARVFISSTFRDMHSERDHLVRIVFPALRERLLPFRIHLDDIDLRWGVTKEQADRDMALDLCLDQIDHSRPFFVGLLGERYGYVPQSFSEETASRYGWIQHLTGKSITELEILYGVLRTQPMHSRSLFCLRDPAFLQGIPEGVRPQMTAENAESAEKLRNLKQAIREAGLPIAAIENYPAQFAGLRIDRRLVRFELAEGEATALEAVAEDGLVTPEEYSGLSTPIKELLDAQATVQLGGLEEFGRAVQEGLWQAIQAEYELPEVPLARIEGERDELAEELDHHHRFMESRLRVYIGREKINSALTEFADGDETVPCLVTGPSGSGKSAALARFATDYPERQAEVLVIPHFVGASPESTNLRQMLRRFCLTLAREFGSGDTLQEEGRAGEVVPVEVPQTIDELVPRFRELLERVPSDRRVVLIIDALNQLDAADNAHLLYWLPREWPPNVKAVMSCISDPDASGQVMAAFAHRPSRRLELAGLTGDERLEIVRAVPSLSAKTLDRQQVDLLLENPATENPLFLLVALEELRGFGSFEHLDSRIRAFPRRGDTITAIFSQVIERLEDDFGAELTEAVLSLLGSARRGLSERELLELIEGIGRAIDQSNSKLFPVLRQIRPYLMQRGELNDFFHQNFLKAVRENYLASDGRRAAAHQRLVDYFHGQDYWIESLEEQRARAKRLPPTPRPANIRKVDELPWQVLEVAKLLGRDDPRSPHWDAVADLIADWQFLEAKTEAGLIFDLATDFFSIIEVMPASHPRLRIISLLDEAIRRDAHFIKRYPTTLFQCAWNCGWWHDGPRDAQPDLHDDGEDQSPDRQIAEPRISHLLETWRREKEAHTPAFHWLRSIRPSPLMIGSGLKAVLRGHEKPIHSVVFSSDGLQVISGSEDGTIRLWEAATGAEVAVLCGHTAAVNRVATHRNGQLIASGSDDHTVRIWNYHNGAELAVLRGHSNAVTGVAFSPDGKRIASSSLDGTVRLWNAEAPSTAEALLDYGKGLTSVVFGPDGQVIVSGTSDDNVCLWHYTTSADPMILSGHTDRVNSVALSPDGRRIASGSADHTLRFWEIGGGPISTGFGHEWPVESICYSPDGLRIASGMRDGTVSIWDSRNGCRLRTLRGPERLVRTVVFSPDGRQIASGGDDGSVQLWRVGDGAESPDLRQSKAAGSPSSDAALPATASACERGTGRLQCPLHGVKNRALVGFTSGVLCATFSPDGRRIAGGFVDGPVRLWEIDRGEEVAVLRGHEDQVSSVAFSPDGERLASTSHDETLRLWDVETGMALMVLHGEAARPGSVVFSPDGRHLAGSLGSSIRLWDSFTGGQLHELRGHDVYVTCLAFSADGRQLVSGSGDGTARIWDVETGAEMLVIRHGENRWRLPSGERLKAIVSAHNEEVRRVGFSRDGRQVFSINANGVRIWDVNDGTELPAHSGHEGSAWCSFAPSGACLVVSLVRGVFNPDGTLRIYDAKRGNEIATLRGHSKYVTCVAFSPDGRFIASAAGDRTLRLWDANGDNRGGVQAEHESRVRDLAFSSDGKLLVSGSDDMTVRLWSVKSGASIAVLRGHHYMVTRVLFRPDSKLIASVSKDKTIRLWETDGRTATCIRDWKSGSVLGLAFSPDGRFIATANEDWGVHLWNTESGEELAVLRGHTHFATSVAFSQDGTQIVSGSRDASVRVWDVESGCELAAHRWPGIKCYTVLDVAFSPDGQKIASAEDDMTTRLRDAHTGEGLEVIQGLSDVRTLAAGPIAYPYRAVAQEFDTVVERVGSPCPITRLPRPLTALTTHPSGRTWAGCHGNHIYGFTLEDEGAEP